VLAAVISAEAAPLRGARLNRLTDEIFHEQHPELEGRALDPRRSRDAALIREWNALRDRLRGSWDERSSAGTASSARGAAQFLAGTWVEEAQRRGTYLNEVARQMGLVDGNDFLVPGRRQELLDLRYDRTLSVVAAAEYDQKELDTLLASGVVGPDLTDLEIAQYLYLCHHEGAPGALALLTGTLSNEVAAGLLAANVANPRTRSALVERHGGEAAAYRAYLWGYIEERIRPERFRATPPPAPAPDRPAGPRRPRSPR
jgi:hypothetical protein